MWQRESRRSGEARKKKERLIQLLDESSAAPLFVYVMFSCVMLLK